MRAPIKDTMLACEEYLRRIVQAQKMAKKSGKMNNQYAAKRG